jgi:hypothetical protein
MPDRSQSGARPPAVRASDDERQHLVELLGEHAAAGRITWAELEERVGRAYAATSREDLAALTRDLPVLAGSPESLVRARRRSSQWVVAIMGGSTRRKTRRLSGRLNIISIMGGDDLDLREVEIEGDELVINAFSLMGGPDIYVPDSVEVELSGPVIIGGNDERGSARPARPGAPLIRIRSFGLLGGADVWRLPAESRGMSLKAARRAARELERGTR